MKPSEFLAKYGSAFVIACQDSGIFPSVKLAQAALETGWGKSVVGNNMFGIKASGSQSPYWHGEAVSAGTSEFENGSYVGTVSKFRKYATVADSIRDHTWFLEHNSRYAKAGVFTAQTPEEQSRALQSAGYATDPSYASKLISIINSNNLKRFDQKKKYMRWIEITFAAVSIVFAAYIIYKNTR